MQGIRCLYGHLFCTSRDSKPISQQKQGSIKCVTSLTYILKTRQNSLAHHLQSCCLPTTTHLYWSNPSHITIFKLGEHMNPKSDSPYICLANEQFTTPLTSSTSGSAAEQAGFDGVWTSDHFQPWQPNENHAGQAWVLLSALTQRTSRIQMGTGVTCPIYRYNPAVVAQVWASLSLLAPNRVFLGLGLGEKLNEGASGGGWAPTTNGPAEQPKPSASSEHSGPATPYNSKAEPGTLTVNSMVHLPQTFPST